MSIVDSDGATWDVRALPGKVSVQVVGGRQDLEPAMARRFGEAMVKAATAAMAPEQPGTPVAEQPPANPEEPATAEE